MLFHKFRLKPKFSQVKLFHILNLLLKHKKQDTSTKISRENNGWISLMPVQRKPPTPWLPESAIWPKVTLSPGRDPKMATDGFLLSEQLDRLKHWQLTRFDPSVATQLLTCLNWRLWASSCVFVCSSICCRSCSTARSTRARVASARLGKRAHEMGPSSVTLEKGSFSAMSNKDSMSTGRFSSSCLETTSRSFW